VLCCSVVLLSCMLVLLFLDLVLMHFISTYQFRLLFPIVVVLLVFYNAIISSLLCFISVWIVLRSLACYRLWFVICYGTCVAYVLILVLCFEGVSKYGGAIKCFWFELV